MATINSADAVRIVLRMPEHEIEQRPVQEDQEAVDRVAALVRNPSADEVIHQHRNQRHRQSPAAAAIEYVLVNASGPNSLPSWASSVNTGTKLKVMISRLKNNAGPTSAAASAIRRACSAARRPPVRILVIPGFEMLVCVLDHDHRGVDHRADGDRDPAQGHDVGVDALPVHDGERGEDAERQAHDGDKRRAQVKQKQRTDQRDDDEFLDQSVAQRRDRSVNQLRSVIGRNDLDASREACCRVAIFALTASIVSSAFLPARMTMTPPTASPLPSSSEIPRRSSGPI